MSVFVETPMPAPTVPLASAGESDYCGYARQVRGNEFWWYFNGTALYRRFSRPFCDPTGRWWYCVKPGFAWPVDFFRPFPSSFRSPQQPFLLGWQFPVASEEANSTVSMNVIRDLSDYGLHAVADNKRRAIRKGLRQLDVVRLDPADPETARSAWEVWNSHVLRTGWNRAMTLARFAATWRELAAWPGTTVLGARSRSNGGPLCAWLIARVIDGTLFVDTLASHTDRLADRPNDAIVFTALCSARALRTRQAHYSLCSNIASLEDFKQSLGFTACPLPARLHLRRPVALGLRLLIPRIHGRLHGLPPGGGGTRNAA